MVWINDWAAFTTSVKKAASSRVAGVVCAGRRVWMTFLHANTSSSSRKRSRVDGAPVVAGSHPDRSRCHNRLRATNRVSEEDEAQWGEVSTWLYTAAQLLRESYTKAAESVRTAPNGSTKDERLDDITLYWFTGTPIWGRPNTAESGSEIPCDFVRGFLPRKFII